ncbi:MAG: YeeE/YedE family protein [Gammaproteobacteria bacterium]|nr:YeeE/YedE family protein [Gammaproteobacteria bacterium]
MYSSALFGGVLIGLAAGWLYLSLGRIAGISGIVGQLVRNSSGLWPLGFVIGLGIGGLAVMAELEPSPRMEIDHGVLVLAGLIVGFGTRLGSGCTSGHGVCGIARFSKRSVIATCVFVGTGMLTATLLRATGVLPS